MFRLLMRPFALAFVLAALAAAVVVHPPKPAYACSCMMPPQPLEARDQAQAVFSGTVSDVQPGKDGVLVTFDVARVWKGPDDARLTLTTPGSSASCGVEFAPGEEYLVYGFVQDGQLSTNLCTRTAPLANAADDITALGEGAAPAAGAPLGENPAEPAAPAATPWLPLALGAAAVLAVAAVAYTTLVRRER